MAAELFAGAFLSSTFQVTFERLASLDIKEFFSNNKLDELAKKLKITLNSINQVLEEAEKKQYESSHVKEWLDDLKHAAYEADQILDEIATDAMMNKLKAEAEPIITNVVGFFSSFITNPFESRINAQLENLQYLARQKKQLGLKEGPCDSNEAFVSWKASKTLPTSAHVDESSIYGREGGKEAIIKFLLASNDSGNKVPIISIVGLGGMGKTTLAQLVYNDPMVKQHFELKAWVHVSESLDLVGLTKAILKSFQFSTNCEDLYLLQDQLHHRLTDKKYLLVLDDIWNTDAKFWEQLLLPFNHGSSGSKIIVTTRDNDIASAMGSNQRLHLKPLEKKYCCNLFVKHAFQGRKVSEFPILESIGEKIVDKCGGLPIAVKTLGQLLRKKFSQTEWIEILDTDMWRLSDRDKNINLALRLSYHNLSSIQKRCFAYCSIFPKGYKFQKGELIRFWMADGLLKCCGTYKTEEELGNEVFDDLESISFFQQTFFLYKHYFVMHDLVHDLAKSVSGEFGIHIDGARVEGILERTRHIFFSLQLDCDDKILEPIGKHKRLRSLIIYHDNKNSLISNNLQHDLFSRLKCLRMLSFRDCGLSELVGEISNLKLLRYLDLSCNMITSLPDSICELYNLQTLLLKKCQLTELPSDFSKLINLRHLKLPTDLGKPSIKKMPKHLGNLNNLQNLNYFTVKEHSGSDLNELGKLNHLHGEIHIEGLGNVIDLVDVTTTILKDKKYLEEVFMKFDGGIGEMNVLEALQPNSNLQRLIIEEYKGNSFPNWLSSDHLPNLVSLQMINCRFSSLLPPLWKLPSLKELYIKNCGGIKIIGEESYDNDSTIVPFKSLEILYFVSMYDWEEWNCSPKGFPLLKELSIIYCPKLKRGLPQHLPSLETLEIRNCKELKASIPRGDNIKVLDVQGCDSILVSELSPKLKRFVLHENRHTEFSMNPNLFNNVILEELNFTYGNSELTFGSNKMYISNWRSSSLPFSLHSFTNFFFLVLRNCPQLKSFPIGGLPPNLSKLEIKNCPELECFPPGGLPSNLNDLEINNCPELESFPPGGLPPNLSMLEIEKCPKLIASREEWGLFQLNSLKSLCVSDHDFENVEDSFPEEGLLPPTLEYLELSNCSKLRIINYKGLLHLNSLKSLFIYDCPSLERLPEEGLPNSLYFLWINHCPILKEFYKKEEGERWHTICHILSVFIH